MYFRTHIVYISMFKFKLRYLGYIIKDQKRDKKRKPLVKCRRQNIEREERKKQ